MPTTMMAFGFNEERKITGEEDFPIVGGAISRVQALAIYRECIGLKYSWDCDHKARAAKKVLGYGTVMFGACMVLTKDLTNPSTYGHYFNPPYEFHAWLQHGHIIIDVAMPMLIEKGLVTCDEIGPALVGNEPVIIAGPVPQWARYVPVHEDDEL